MYLYVAPYSSVLVSIDLYIKHSPYANSFLQPECKNGDRSMQPECKMELGL